MNIEQETQDTVETVAAPETILFFAYGTLRRGEALHDLIERSIVADLGKSVVKGARLHYSRTHRHFPYLVWTGQIADRAVGEVYELRLDDATLAMLVMEANAGYRIVDASAESPEGDLHEVTLCAWPHEHGPQVPLNDWCSTERREWWL